MSTEKKSLCPTLEFYRETMYWVAINDSNQQEGEDEREQQHRMIGLLVDMSRRKRGRIREGEEERE